MGQGRHDIGKAVRPSDYQDSPDGSRAAAESGSRNELENEGRWQGFTDPPAAERKMHQSEDIYTTSFEDYKKLGLDPLPIPYEDGHPTKGPKIAGWVIKAEHGDYTKKDFSKPCNIGVLLGGQNHITDIDCDSPEAVSIGVEIMGLLMEKTGKTMMFGRN